MINTTALAVAKIPMARSMSSTMATATPSRAEWAMVSPK